MCKKLFITLFCIILHFLEFQAIINFVLNHRLIKKDVNKQIKLFSLGKGGASINLWAFPLGNKSFKLY